VRGNRLPVGLSKGQVFWHPHQGEALIGRVVAIDKRAGTASSFGCPDCCVFEPSDWESSPDPFGGPVGGQQQMTLYEYDSLCGQFRMGPYQATGVYNVYSDNPPVATVNASNAMVSFVSPGYANIVWQIEYWHSDYISAEDCGSSPIFTTVPCPVAAVTVMIKKADGAALPNPLQVGITATTLNGIVHDRNKHLRAVVTPASEAANVIIKVSSKLQLSNVAHPSGAVTFDVVGTSASASHSDALISARYSGTTVATAAVEVIVPHNVSATHDTVGNGLVIENRALDASTSPAILFLLPGQVQLSTIYVRFLNVTVCDQFGGLIGELYQGAEVSEFVSRDGQFHSINQFLTSVSTYSDPEGAFVTATIVAAGSNAANQWPNQARKPAPSGCNLGPLESTRVKVDGFELSPAIDNRQWTLCGNGLSFTSPPVTLTISWP
jgi:hypothetical protein